MIFQKENMNLLRANKPNHNYRLVSNLVLYIKLEIIEIRTISRGRIKCYC